MRDKRPVDELSIEELERILAIRKREERQKRMEKMQRSGRMVNQPEAPAPAAPPPNGTPRPVVAAAPAPPAANAVTAPAPVPVTPPVPPQPEWRDGVLVRPNGANGGESAAPALLDDETPAPRFEDDPPGTNYTPRRPRDNRAARRFMNGILLLVEAAAVFGLILMGAQLYGAIGTLERETASAAALADEQRRAGIPTIEPTPQLGLEDVVLPGGHIFTASGAPQFNYSEIPAHLLPVVQSQLAQPVISRPRPTDQTALALIIPKLNVNQTIVQGVDWEALRLGIGQLPNGITPTSREGNLVLSAHNDIYGEYFRDLDQLVPGDQFQVQTRTQIVTYTVTGSEIVQPTDVHVMENRDGATATLISCYPYQVNDKRIVVYAVRENT
jgi:sortase A